KETQFARSLDEDTTYKLVRASKAARARLRTQMAQAANQPNGSNDQQVPWQGFSTLAREESFRGSRIGSTQGSIRGSFRGSRLGSTEGSRGSFHAAKGIDWTESDS
ncbi:hypothetical protein T484DRAFT_1832268, partial [Baffinella frigidus]